MSAPVPSTRRLAIAIGTAATATTFAIGVTAASLLGWFAPTAEPVPEPAISAPATPAASPVILVPVEPTPAPTGPTAEVQVAMESDDDGRDREHHGREHHGRDHDDREEDHDDD